MKPKRKTTDTAVDVRLKPPRLFVTATNKLIEDKDTLDTLFNVAEYMSMVLGGNQGYYNA
jgi:hypothetical protein